MLSAFFVMNDNPYQTPQSANVTTSGEVGAAAYQDPLSGYLVINKKFESLRICLFTGETENLDPNTKKLTLRYVPLALRISPVSLYLIYSLCRHSFFPDLINHELASFAYLAIIIPSTLLSFFYQKKTDIYTFLGPTLQAKVLKRKKIAYFSFLPALLMLISAAFNSDSLLSALLVVGALGTIGYAVGLLLCHPKPLKVKKYKSGYFFLKGVHPSVLAKYPHLPDELA